MNAILRGNLILNGMSTDAKPELGSVIQAQDSLLTYNQVFVKEGATYHEIDTGNDYMLAGDGQWYEQSRGGDPGGGGGGSGLPDPSELPDGTALVSVNGEWHEQSGYGYTETEKINLLTEDEIEVEFLENSAFFVPGVFSTDLIDISKFNENHIVNNPENIIIKIDNTEYQTFFREIEGEVLAWATDDFVFVIGGEISGTLMLMFVMSGGGLAGASFLSTDPSFEGTHTISIYEESETVTPIDDKYLPDSLATQEYVNSAIADAITDALGGDY